MAKKTHQAAQLIRSRIVGHGDVAPGELLANPLNYRRHPGNQMEALRGSLQQLGWIKTIIVNKTTGHVLDGHARVEEALRKQEPTVPVTIVELSPEEEKLALAVLDPITELAVADQVILDALLKEVSTTEPGLDALLRQMAGQVDEAVLAASQGSAGIPGTGDGTPGSGTATPGGPGGYGAPTEEQRGALLERFGAPPFTVLDTRQGYWQERREKWLAVTGNLTETKEGVLAEDSLMSEINEGSSNFDPVLAELMMRWFCPPRGSILDPFGGEQTKGVVAGTLGFTYRAVEFRPEQVEVNRRACAAFPTVAYQCGDSEGIAQLVKERGFDLCFTSPPYYDLEVYSKEDMSALGTYDEFMAKYERIFAACVSMLRDGAFLAIKVGEIRDKKTGAYRNFVGDNIAMFRRLGLHYYNELILVNSAGTAPLRAGRMFQTRKMVKVHQNVLVFWKGDLAGIGPRFEGVQDAGAQLPE